MFAFVFTLVLIWLAMWAFFKFMYPKPPKEFMPKKGDIITPRDCDLCGYPLAEYRGVIEAIPQAQLAEAEQTQVTQLTAEVAAINEQILAYETTVNDKAHQKTLTRQQKKQASAQYEQLQKQLFEKNQQLKKMTSWFFCNYDHQADFHANRAP
ncbi:hypothetical protein [Psychrobacter phenylpyruvicus]|uniref:Uncharacterized protein n=1 Tax=Psychrobacter phenylpyruvicus TaxID=29432 RepID=A0A379LHR3_9GAMM|nr:hypothetical protein [Psychrobacter phenylpyruvicus]SUD90106.1 Uncharacterised protein [Psychrobacter phenylpyruvicus]